MTAVPEIGRVDLPFPKSATVGTLITTWTNQSSTIKLCADYPNASAVQTAVGEADAAVALLQGTQGKILNLEAEVLALKLTRTQQVGVAIVKHDNVEAAINARTNGNPQAAKDWTGKLKTRAKPAAVTQDTTPPTGASAAPIKAHHGSVAARCNPEPSAEGCMFQTGGDPLHPENWTNADTHFVHGHTYTFRNLPIGSTLYLRIAIVRRGGVTSLYTPVLQVVVR